MCACVRVCVTDLQRLLAFFTITHCTASGTQTSTLAVSFFRLLTHLPCLPACIVKVGPVVHQREQFDAYMPEQS